MKKYCTKIVHNSIFALSIYCRIKKNVFLAFCLTLLIALPIAAQSTLDIVYLANGSVIKGTITEQIIGKSVEIQTRDGNMFEYKMESIAKVAREPLVQQNVLAGQSLTSEIGNRDQTQELVMEPDNPAPLANSIGVSYYLPIGDLGDDVFTCVYYERRFGRFFAMTAGIGILEAQIGWTGTNGSMALPDLGARVYLISGRLFTLAIGASLLEQLTIIPQFLISRNFGVGLASSIWLFEPDKVYVYWAARLEAHF